MASNKYDTGHNARMRRLHAEAAEIEIPQCSDFVERQKCLNDPVRFIQTCCSSALRHDIPPLLQDFVRKLVQTMTNGGTVLSVLPRGSGKSTLVCCTIIYGLVAQIIHFPVICSSSQSNANNLLRLIWRIVEQNDKLFELFPEFAAPVRALEGKWQRCASMTHNGERVNLKSAADMIRFGTIDGISYGQVKAVGCGGSVRGMLAEGGVRPDAILVDDPVRAADARSSTKMEALERFINEDLRGLQGSDNNISMFVTATPLSNDDAVSRLSKRPDVTTFRYPLIITLPKRKDLWDQYQDLYYGDLADGTENAHDFYVQNQTDMDDGVEMLDPLAYPPNLSSAIEKAMQNQVTMGKDSFAQEYQLEIKSNSDLVELDPVEISKHLSNVPHRIVPAECSVVLAAIDVGTATNLTVTCVAYGRHLIGEVCDIYKFPDNGRLLPKNLPEQQTDVLLTRALVGVIENLVAPGRYRQEATGKTVPVTAIAVDRGFKTTVVDQVAAYFARRRIQVFPAKGFPSTAYYPSKATIGRADNCDLREVNGRRFLAFNADTMKLEVIQGFRGTPMTTGALSFYGSDASKVLKWAQEVAGEKLVDRYEGYRGTVYRWAPSSVGIGNHVLDSLTMNLSLAQWLRYRQPDSVATVVKTTPTSDGNVTTVQPVAQPTRKIHRRSRIVIR